MKILNPKEILQLAARQAREAAAAMAALQKGVPRAPRRKKR